MGNTEPSKSSAGNSILPNTFMCPNVFVDRLLPLLTPEEWIVLSYVVRAVLGWQDKIGSREDYISLSQFEYGQQRESGWRNHGCGLKRPAIMRALEALNRYRVVLEKGDPDVRKGQKYHLQGEYDQIDWDGLEQRKQAEYERDQARTAKAREKVEEKRRSVRQTAKTAVSETDYAQSVGQTARSQFDIPLAVSGTDTQKTGNSDQTQEKPNIAPDGAKTAPPREAVGAARSHQPREPEPETPPPKEPTIQQQYFTVVCELCGWTADTLSKKDEARVGTAAAKLHKSGYTLEEIGIRFRQFWYTQRWEGRDKQQPPEPEQITRFIGSVRQAGGASPGGNASANGRKPKGDAAIEEYMQRKGIT